ncbi:MAG TPA: calcium-binding protein [Allosphingosinicella sp.]|nr:calcium-binding protein [Allosphingosinicella sp.]
MKIMGTEGNENNVDLPALVGTAEDDRIHGHGGNDFLVGMGGDDRLFGGTGHDVLIGGGGVEDPGDDHMVGGEGNDLLRAGLGDDFVNGGGGIDRATFFVNPGLNPGITSGVTVSLMINGKAQDTGYGLKKLVGIEHLSGTAFTDHLTGDQGDNWLFGGSGGDDSYFGLGGDDLITVAAGDEYVDGGSGNDSVSLWGNGAVAGPVTVSLELQDGWQATGAGSLYLTSIENLSGTESDDSLTGDRRGNVLAGWAGSDTLVGGRGNDTLLGDGEITMSGDEPAGGTIVILQKGSDDPAGDDVLTGGRGADALSGGAGADTFVYTGILDSRVGRPDRIRDFDGAEGDRIDLAAIDADRGSAGDQAFSFIGTAGFSGAAGELRAEDADDGMHLFGDVNGDAIADFEILVRGDEPIVAADLVL